MTKKVLSMKFYGEYSVIFDDKADVNPYRVKYTAWVQDGERFRKKTKTIGKYGDFKSCILCLNDYVEPGEVHPRN